MSRTNILLRKPNSFHVRFTKEHILANSLITSALLSASIVALFLSLPACSQNTSSQKPTKHLENVQMALIDCTAECAESFPQHLEWFGANPYPREAVPLQLVDVSPETRKHLIEISSKWAVDNCYLPCAYEMCGCLLKDSVGFYGVYIRPTVNEESAIMPEALIFIDPKSFQVVEEIRYHSPCRDYARTIDWNCDSRTGGE